MIKDEKASLSIRKIVILAVILMALLGVSVMATSTQVNNVKIILSNNYEMNVLTTKEKVGDVLAESHIVVLPDEIVIPNLEADITESKTITITKALEAGNTIIKLAEENNEVSIEELLGNYSSVVERIVTEQVEIPFETITKNSSSVDGVINKVIKEGKNGIKEITYKAKYRNDVEIERTILSEKIIKEPVNRIVQVSTKSTTNRSSVERTTYAPDTSSSSTLASKVAGITPTVKTFNTSAYCACMKCCGKTNGITSSGAKATSWYTVAAGKDYPIGTIIYIPALKDKPNGGWFVVQDRGGAITNSKLDIYMSTHTQALQFGRKSLECYVYYM